jgi:hypothetical protein
MIARCSAAAWSGRPVTANWARERGARRRRSACAASARKALWAPAWIAAWKAWLAAWIRSRSSSCRAASQLAQAACSRSRSRLDILSAARRAQAASTSPMASTSSARRAGCSPATTAPRCGRSSTRSMAASCFKASRTGVRETAKRCASATSSSRCPAASSPLRIASAMASLSASARVRRTAPSVPSALSALVATWISPSVAARPPSTGPVDTVNARAAAPGRRLRRRAGAGIVRAKKHHARPARSALPGGPASQAGARPEKSLSGRRSWLQVSRTGGAGRRWPGGPGGSPPTSGAPARAARCDRGRRAGAGRPGAGKIEKGKGATSRSRRARASRARGRSRDWSRTPRQRRNWRCRASACLP